MPQPQTSIKTVLNAHGVTRQVLSVPFEAVCSVSGKPFSGYVYIKIWPQKYCMEYCSVEEFVKEYATLGPVLHEQIAGQLAEELANTVECAVSVNVVVTHSEAHQPAEAEVQRRPYALA